MKSLFLNKALWLVGGILLGGIITYIFSPDSHSEAEQMHHHDAKETTYTCSMHPQIRRNEAGQCPICGMDLIPVSEANDEQNPDAVKMSETAMKLANIQTTIVGSSNTSSGLRLTGKVQPDERLTVSQTAHVGGRIEKLLVNFTGEEIRSGQTIAYIYSPELVTAQKELLQAYENREDQPELFRAAKEKMKNWKLTDNQIQQIIDSEKPLDSFPIVSNTNGYIIEKLVNSGDHVMTGGPIYKVADLSRVWVMIDVYESDLNSVKKGNVVNFTVPSLPGETFQGKISFVDPVINSKTRVAQARVEISNTELKLKPEMFVNATILPTKKANEETITVPKSAVMWTGKRSLVYVKSTTDQGVYFNRREVTLGKELEDAFEIESGLTAGEEIATNGTFSIDAAAQLAGKPSMMNVSQTEAKVETVAKMQQEVPVTKQGIQQMQALFKAYFSAKEALANDDESEAKSQLASMNEKLKAVDMHQFHGENHMTWMGHQKQLSTELKTILEADDIESIRKAFIPLSNSMIELAQQFKPLQETVYILHCPMAGSDGADWLSEEEEVRNPYFGSSMLKCGGVKGEIE